MIASAVPHVWLGPNVTDPDLFGEFLFGADHGVSVMIANGLVTFLLKGKPGAQPMVHPGVSCVSHGALFPKLTGEPGKHGVRGERQGMINSTDFGSWTDTPFSSPWPRCSESRAVASSAIERTPTAGIAWMFDASSGVSGDPGNMSFSFAQYR